MRAGLRCGGKERAPRNTGDGILHLHKSSAWDSMHYAILTVEFNSPQSPPY